MNTPNKILMADARESLEGKWGLAIGAFFVLMLVSSAAQVVPFIGIIGSFIIGGPLALGAALFSLSLSKREHPRFEQIFDGFKKFETSFIAYLVTAVLVFLWSLLLIIPGIIAAISYSQTFYIIAQDDNIAPYDAMQKSRMMMEGYKAKYFRMMLRFMGWGILCIFTLGIGFLFLIPYVHVSTANFHRDISEEFEVGTNYREDILDDDLV